MEISYRDFILKRLTFQVKSDEGLNLGSEGEGRIVLAKGLWIFQSQYIQGDFWLNIFQIFNVILFLRY